MNPTNPSYAIIGGGISGLSAAWYLRKRFPEASIYVFESSDRLGGVLQTDYQHGFIIEQAADMFVTQPDAAMQLCKELHLDSELYTTQPVEDRAFIGLGEDIFPVPKGLSMMVPTLAEPILETALLSEEGKQRFLDEHLVPPAAPNEDESLQSFAIRRFGVEAYQKIIQPMVSGIYTADPEKLSMRATMKRFFDMEQSAGSLIEAHRREKEAAGKSTEDEAASGARYSLFRAPACGLNSMIMRLEKNLAATMTLTVGASVSALTPITNATAAWRVRLATGTTQDFDGVIVATGANAASKILSEAASELSSTLAEIETASSAIVAIGLKRSQLQKPFTGFGIIYPHVDNGQVIAISFSSNKFKGRCADDELLIRVFIGGALQSSLVDLDDESLVNIATQQLNKSLGLTGAPLFQKVYRWRNCMPQYHIGHTPRVEKIESLVAEQPNLELAGNSYHGVGVPACVASGKSAALRINP